MTAAQFLDGLDAELDRAPDSGAVDALLGGQRIKDALANLQGAAAARLREWQKRAVDKANHLRILEETRKEIEAEPEAEKAADGATEPADDLGEWPAASEEAAPA
jgi:hypothetical protein